MQTVQPQSLIRRRAIGAILAFAVAVAACSTAGDKRAGGGDAGPAKSATTSRRSTNSSNTEPKATIPAGKRTFKLASATYSKVEGDIPSDPIASTPAQVKGSFLDIYALQRTGSKSVLLVFGLRNESISGKGIAVGTDLGSVAGTDYTASGVSLFDPSGLKRYLVYLDSHGDCLCSDTDLTDIERGQSLIFAAELPAPPSGVNKVVVQTPLGAVADVELSNG